MTVYESLRELEAFLSQETRSFIESAKTCEEKGMSKSAMYTHGVVDAYTNVIGRLRGIIPERLLKDLTSGI